jgi:tRNA(Ile)-lysidine synthetase-like protein
MDPIYIVIILSIVTILFAFFYNIIYCKKKVEKKNDDFQYLLETPKDYYFGMEDIISIDQENPLVKTMDDFCLLNNIYSNGAIVSLSGGVDSMVVLAILIRLSKIYKFNIYACSINYNLRDEQSDEIKFIEKYCNTHNVKLYIASISGYSRKKEESGPRTEFEEESRKIRFDLYTEVMNKHNCTGIFVGHHKDDIIENIFTNSMKGGNLLDLEVMKVISNIHNVNIYRPYLDYHKISIYELAHKYQIPYFLDTTPTWSRRGKMRNEIFPLFDSIFSKSWRVKLKDLGEQSNQWGDYINTYIIQPWFSEIIFGKYGFFMTHKEQPKLIYTNVIVKAMHKMGKHMLKSTSVDKIINNKNIKNKVIHLDSGFCMYNFENNFIIFHKESLQKEIDYNPIKIVNEKAKTNIILDFINGTIYYKQPDDVSKNFTPEETSYGINKLKYKEMNCDLSLDLIKNFTFRRSPDYVKDKWIVTGKSY